MADVLLSKAQDLFEGQIDFAGQKKAEFLSTIVLIATGVIAFVVGLIQQDIHLTLWIGLGGTLVTFFMVVPPWPAYNEDPQPWLPASTGGQRLAIEVDGKKVN